MSSTHSTAQCTLIRAERGETFMREMKWRSADRSWGIHSGWAGETRGLFQDHQAARVTARHALRPLFPLNFLTHFSHSLFLILSTPNPPRGSTLH